MSPANFAVKQAWGGINRCHAYSDNWYYWRHQLSIAVKLWRTENTLTLVK